MGPVQRRLGSGGRGRVSEQASPRQLKMELWGKPNALGAPVETRTQDPIPSLFLMAPEFGIKPAGGWRCPFAPPHALGTQAGRGAQRAVSGRAFRHLGVGALERTGTPQT